MKKITILTAALLLIGGVALAHEGEADSQTAEAYGAVTQPAINGDPDFDLQPAGTKATYDSVQKAGTPILGEQPDSATRVKFLDVVNEAVKGAEKADVGALRVIEDDSTHSGDMMKGDDSMGENERVLPTVNKREASAPSVSERARVEVRGWDAEKKENVDNLQKNTEAAVDADENIENVDISPDGVKLEYKDSAKLFGFIPVAFSHAFTVDGKGNVASGHPWWLIFATTATSTDSFESETIHIFQHNESDLRYIKQPTQIELMGHYFQSLIDILKAQHEAAKSIIQNIKA